VQNFRTTDIYTFLFSSLELLAAVLFTAFDFATPLAEDEPLLKFLSSFLEGSAVILFLHYSSSFGQ
jgi:hypothetical protein